MSSAGYEPEPGSLLPETIMKKNARDTEYEKKILGTPKLMPKGVAYAQDVLKKRWPEWEEKAIELAADDEEHLPSCVKYAKGVIQGRWTEFEPVLLELFKRGRTFAEEPYIGPLSTNRLWMWEYLENIIQGPWPDAENVVMGPYSHLINGRCYADCTRMGRWLEFEKRLLDPDCEEPLAEQLDEIRLYSQRVVSSRWPEAEEFILHCLKTHPHNEIADRAVRYAADVVQGRWQELEKLLAGHFEWMMSYAQEVLKGRLPDSLHQEMVVRSFGDLSTPAIKKYLNRYGV